MSKTVKIAIIKCDCSAELFDISTNKISAFEIPYDAGIPFMESHYTYNGDQYTFYCSNDISLEANSFAKSISSNANIYANREYRGPMAIVRTMPITGYYAGYEYLDMNYECLNGLRLKCIEENVIRECRRRGWFGWFFRNTTTFN
jgi:hypothetical protein